MSPYLLCRNTTDYCDMKRNRGKFWFMVVYFAERILEKELKYAKCGENKGINKRMIVT